jgi:lysyl-tRNA synthetase, class II
VCEIYNPCPWLRHLHMTDTPDDNALMAERRQKLAQLRKVGPPFPNDFKPTHHAADIQQRHTAVPNEELEPQAITVSVAGRMMLKRVMGKASFATLQDGSFGPTGGRIQLRVATDLVGDEAYAAFKHWDLGETWGTSSAARARSCAPRPVS